MKRFLTLLAFTLAATFSFTSSAYEIGEIPADVLGKAAGKEIKLSDYHGKVVIISFWASWCPPCMKELPVLSGIQKSAGTDELQVIAITHRESRDQYRRVVKAIGTTPMILMHGSSGKAAKNFEVSAIPHMIIIGRDGKVAAEHIGYSEAALPALVAEINEIAARPKP